jgi:hypothetical protein
MNETNNQATLAAQKLQASAPNTYGVFDPTTLITIFTTLFPTLMTLFSACKKTPVTPTPPAATQSATDFIDEHYDNGQYDPIVLGPATTQTLRHLRGQGQRVRRNAARDVAIAALDQTREATPQQYSAVCQENNIPE